MLKYYPQYCEASIAATIILMVMYFLKQNYSTRRNKIFVCMMVNNLCASILNLSTFHTVSYPERYPMWLNYFTNQCYLLVFNMMAVLFLLYIDVMTKRPSFRIFVRVFSVCILIFDALLLFTSSFTHLTIYFDENLEYRHGPWMIMLYVTAFLCIVVANILFILSRKMFNAYQVFSVTGFVAGVFVSVIFQVFHPRYVISNFTCAMMLFFLYSAFENPAYYTYNDTRCFNRLAFLETIHRLKKKGNKYSIVALKMADFDNIVNTYGQENAALISSKVAERLNRSFRKQAYCISINCFTVIDDTNSHVDEIIAEIRRSFSDSFDIDKETEILKVMVDAVIKTIPVSSFEIDGLEMEEIIHSIMNASSEDVSVAEDVEQRVADVHRKREIQRVIRDAIKNDGFQVYYQPILDTKTGKFASAEALIRLIDDEFGFISPEEFIPLAERTGQINAIGEIVFRKVCKFMKESECLQLGVHYIEINLSPVQCRQLELVDTFLAVMKEYEIDPSRVNLEITETAEMETSGFSRLTNIMHRLHNNGVTFSIDDFGSGFAAIDYLVKLPVDLVKIDKSIMWQAMEDPIAMMVLENTIRMIKEIGCKIVVEGVETEKMADTLIAYGCDYLQGYLYSKPVPAGDYLKFLRERN